MSNDSKDKKPNSAAVLADKYTELSAQLEKNQFDRPIHLTSFESSNEVQGDVFALLNYPFEVVSDNLKEPEDWCEIFMLHLNTKYCASSKNAIGEDVLAVRVGKKYYQPVMQAYLIEFVQRKTVASTDYAEFQLIAKKGPVGSHDYQISLSAIPVPGNKTFLHLAYSYEYNSVGRYAMQAYLATVGSSKVGFTSVGNKANGDPLYVTGTRGAIERNTMRYYLAIDAYFASLSSPAEDRQLSRLQNWFSLTELFPQQLHELTRSTYLDMKQKEYLRLKSGSD